MFVERSLRGDGDAEAKAKQRSTLPPPEPREGHGQKRGTLPEPPPRDLLGHGQKSGTLDTPEWVVTYVRLLRGRSLRWLLLMLWFSLAVSGASLYFALAKLLKISVEPPWGSESEAAKITYDQNFPPMPIVLFGLLSTNRVNAPNLSLINSEAEMQLELLPPFFSYNPEGDLTGETEKITLELKQRVQPFLEPVEWPVEEEEEEEEEGAGLGPPPAPPGRWRPKCEFNFYSFFDMPPEVQMVAHSFLFPARSPWNGRSWNGQESGMVAVQPPGVDSLASLHGLWREQEGMVAVHLVSCYGHAVYAECLYKNDWCCGPACGHSPPASSSQTLLGAPSRRFCEPVGELLESWEGYRQERIRDLPDSPVDLTCFSELGLREEILMGLAAGEARSPSQRCGAQTGRGCVDIV